MITLIKLILLIPTLLIMALMFAIGFVGGLLILAAINGYVVADAWTSAIGNKYKPGF